MGRAPPLISIAKCAKNRAKIPGKAVDEYEKALKESSKGNRGKAVEGLQRAVKLAPDFYEARLNLGIALQESGQRERANAVYREILAKAPPRFRREREAAMQLLGSRR